MPDPPRSSSQKRLSEAPSSAAVKEESRVLSSDGVGPPHNKKSVSARQRTPERGRPRIGSTVVAPPLASSQQSPAPALNTSASSSQNAHNSTIPSSLAEHLSPRVRSRSRPRGEEDGVVDGRASGNWRMMSISQLLRRDTDGEVVTGDSKSDRASVGGASNRPPSPTSPGMNNTRNWLGSFLSRATSGNEIKSEARPDTPGDGFSPLMSRRSSSRQRRGSDANDDASSDRASQHTDSTPMPSRLPWLSRKAHADEKRKSVHSESELAASDRRKSVISESDYVSASARKSPGGQRKSVGGSDTEGEGDAKSSGEKKKTWKLFSRVGGSSTDDLSLESQGRDKSRTRGNWFFSGNSPSVETDAGSKAKQKLESKASFSLQSTDRSDVTSSQPRGQQQAAVQTPNSTISTNAPAVTSHPQPVQTPANISLDSSVRARNLLSLSATDLKVGVSGSPAPGGPDTGYQSDESRKGTPSHSSLRESPPAFSDTQSVRASLSRVMGQSQGGGVPSKNSLHRRSTTGQSGIGPTPSPDTLARLPLSLRGLPLASQLILASEHGQIEAIRILLDLGVSPSCRDENSTLLTPLIQAARHGHTAVVELLVERGARLEDRDPDIGGTAVFHAAINGWYETVKVLIALGADPNAPEWTGCTPIFAASFHGHLEVVETLIESGASIDVPGPSGSPIHAAIEGRQMEVLKMLLKRAHDVNAVDAVGRTPLWIASQAGLLPVLELLLDHGADIDKPSDEGTRPLWAAIVNDHPEIACRLVERGCDVQAPLPRGAMGGKLPTPPSTASKSLGFTPLHGAAHRNHARLAHALLERQADPTLEDETQHTPLHLAAMMGNAAVVDVILWHKPLLINSPSATLMRTPLFLAALWNSMEVARLLIDYGADVEAISDPRTIQATALRAAVQGNHHSMVELLLTRGSANPNARAADGSTCLHVTVSNGNVRIAGLLISHGADVDARLSGAGETPLHLATRRRKRNVKSSSSSTSSGGESNNDTLTIIRLLLAANASINLAEERAGLTPLHLAAREGDLAIVALLIGHGADLEALTHSGFSPLAIASLNGRVEVVRELLQCGASPFATSFEGVSVMHAAVMGVGVSGGSSGGATAEASARILRMLLEKGAEVDTTDARGETPLGIASRGGNLYAVKVLVEAGASLDQLAWPKGVPPE